MGFDENKGKSRNPKSSYRLTKDDERRLAKRIKRGDGTAREELLTANMVLVYSIVNNSYRVFCSPYSNIQIDDLYSEGKIGLLRAVDLYDPDKGKFGTYAAFWIRQKVMRFLNENRNEVFIPLNRQLLLRKVLRIIESYEQKNGNKPSSEEIADILNDSNSKNDRKQSARSIENLINNCSVNIVSFDSFIDSTGDVFWGKSEIFEDQRIEVPDDSAGAKVRLELIKSLMEKLTDKERVILERRFGFENKRIMTLEEISRFYNVTRERIRQIEFIALRKMRKHISKLGQNGNRFYSAKEAFS